LNIFITGSNGFIGKHLKEYLSENSDYNLFTPSSKELDLVNESEVNNFIVSNKIDIIIHLANRGGDKKTKEMQNITEYNLRIFFNIVKHEKFVKKIISFGSGAEYGKHKPIINVKESDYLEAFPFDEYGFYKSITSRYIEKSDNIVQLRLFGVYGEYEDYSFRFISNTIVKNLLQMPIVINQNVYFDYLYVGDLVRLIDWFLRYEAKEKIYNVSKGEKVDLLSLANLINEVSDFKSDIKVKKSGLNNEYTSNNKKMLKELGDVQLTSHKNAIVRMREYFKNNLDTLDKDMIVNDSYLKVVNIKG